MIDKVREIEEQEILKAKVRRRVSANCIVALVVFRDHHSSVPGKNSWDLCGKPVYYWSIKAAVESKYLEKVLVWTEVKGVREVLGDMLDKIVFIDRTIDECREPPWKIMNDLKRYDSRVDTGSVVVVQNLLGDRIKNALDFDPTLLLKFQVNRPLVRTGTFDRVVERYFEDDIAERCMAVSEIDRVTWQNHPDQSKYIVRSGLSNFAVRRQELPAMYVSAGPYITSYEWTGTQRTVYVVVPYLESIEIHSVDDMEIAELLMKKRLLEGNS